MIEHASHRITVAEGIQLAEELHKLTVDPSTVRRACQKGYIRHARLEGYTWFFDRVDFEDWLLDAEWQRKGRRLRKDVR